MKLRPFFLIALPLLVISVAHAQSVGLVLSGGGAKGMAHIGVIRVLEENNIPIDFIAGTSIGAIVGGLYAAGYSPDQMEELFKSDDFYFWSTGKIQEEYRYYFMRQEENPSWIELQLEKKEDKLKILPPTNFIPHEQMDFAFMELLATTNAACNYDFDSLMVPFFCIATDVNKSQPVVLTEGDLGTAIRASMTVPLYFKPITINGSLLFDGGIVNNFPQDIMQERFHPDFIIGHKVAEDQKNAGTDDLVQQLSNLVMRPTNFEIPPEKGILLETQLSNVGLLDFQKIDEVVAKGEQTARLMLDSIRTLVQRRVTLKEIADKRKQFNSKKPQLYFQNIQVEGVEDPMQRKYIIQAIKHKYHVISLDLLKKEYFKLIADEHIKSITPIAWHNKETGYFDLHLKVVPNKKLEVRIGGNVSTKPVNQGYTSVNYRFYRGRPYSLMSNLYFGRFYSSFKLGARVDFPTSYPFYLAGYFTMNRWDFFTSSSELFFEDVRPPFIIQNEYNQRFETGMPLGLHGKLWGGVSFANALDEYYQTDVFNKADIPDQTRFTPFCTQVGVEYNSLNYKQFATEGKFRYITASYITGQETHKPGSISSTKTTTRAGHSYFMVAAHTNRIFRISRRFNLGATAEAVFSNKKDFANFRSSKLAAPGFYPTPHSKSLFIENFHANNYLAGGLNAIFMIKPNVNIHMEGYGFLPVNEKTAESFPQKAAGTLFKNYYLQGAASLVYHTGVGPLSLSLNYYEKKNTQWYFSLNFGYILFNKRGF